MFSNMCACPLRPYMVYGFECWIVEKVCRQDNYCLDEDIRWTSNKTEKDKIKREDVRDNLEITQIEDEMKEHYLRWLRTHIADQNRW